MTTSGKMGISEAKHHARACAEHARPLLRAHELGEVVFPLGEGDRVLVEECGRRGRRRPHRRAGADRCCSGTPARRAARRSPRCCAAVAPAFVLCLGRCARTTTRARRGGRRWQSTLSPGSKPCRATKPGIAPMPRRAARNRLGDARRRRRSKRNTARACA